MRLRPGFAALAVAVTLAACFATGTGDGGDGDDAPSHDAAPPDAPPPLPDADGDGIPDTVEGAPSVDTDGDTAPDYLDPDSDGDGVRDYYERALDYDNDGTPNFRDEDADGDCVADELEGGEPPRDNDGDSRWDFLDRDSDDDGISDGDEDADCDGVVDAGETSATSDDTDGDGVTDLVEETAGTDPGNASDNPQSHGDFVFVEPYQQPQSPTADDLDFSTHLKKLDVYVLLDRSASMQEEITSVRDNFAETIDAVQCPPQGSGDTETCVPDLWAGAGSIGYTTGESFTNHADIQPTPSMGAIPSTEPSGCCLEPETFALWTTITGLASSAQPTCTVTSVAARNCAGSPAATSGYTAFGQPCFRDGALPVVMLATDEGPRSDDGVGAGTYQCPAWANTTRYAFKDRSAKLVGIIGSSPSATAFSDLRTMATYTGAVDSLNNNEPLVLDGAGANADLAIAEAIRTIAAGVPLDLSALAFDDTADAVDAVGSFVDHLETLQAGTALCTAGLGELDTDGDGFDDYYVDVRTGVPVCWRVVSKLNTTVPATTQPQLFRASVAVYGDGVTELDRRDVYFLVPPAPFDPPVD